MRLGGFAIALVLAFAAPAAAAPVELRNDGFEGGMAAGFQAGFSSGEIGAVRLTPASAGAHQVLRVNFLFGGATTTQTITLRIYQDGTGPTPGTEIFSGDYTVIGSNEAFQEIDLSGDSVFVSGPFRVGIEFQHTGAPSIARDEDGTIDVSENYIFSSGLGWRQSDFYGLTGDWIIRATVDDGGAADPDAGVPAPDAAPPGTPDASVPGPDGGAGECVSNGDCAVGQYCNEFGACSFDCRENSDCGSDMACNSLGMCVAADGDGGGCGCRTGTRTGEGAPVLLLLLGIAAWLRRRRA